MHELLRNRAELRTVGAIQARAAEHAARWRDPAPILAVLTGFESPAELAFLRALPNVSFAAWGVRPRRAAYAKRFEALFGERAPGPEGNCAQPQCALEHLQAHLFEDSAMAPAPRDDSVTIALYAGVHEEVEAAASWVTRQILENATAAQDIAVLTPTAEPYGALLRARIAAVSGMATFSERGTPLSERADGARILVLLSALEGGLSRDSLAPLLPLLRVSDENCRVRGLARAWEVLNTVAATGGTHARWPAFWQTALEQLKSAPHTGGGLEERDMARRSELQQVLSALAAAVDQIDNIFTAVNSNEPLHLLWSRLHEYLLSHVKLPPFTPPAITTLDEACAQFRGHEALEPCGADALAWLRQSVGRITVRSERFGEPAIYLGTLAGVRGLRFRAVRVLGLAEGSVPSANREDPVLPDAERVRLSPFLLGSRERAHRQVTAFDDAVRCARERLCLTAPRASIEGSTRQPASVLLDVMRALTGSNAQLEKALEHAAARGRMQERDARDRYPVSKSAQLERIARGDTQLASAERDPALSLSALRSIRERGAATAQDGLLGGLMPVPTIAGLGPDRPISASRLATLLSCPHRFLYENILGFREPAQPLPTHSLQLMMFGTWLHAIAEEFWMEHGRALSARHGDLSQAQKQLRELASARFETLRQTYPFANDLVAGSEREALCDQLEKLLTLDWSSGKAQTFIGVERAFGYAGECDLETNAGPLYVRGKIDKLDCIDGTLLVRDIKTGAGKPRRADDEPDPGIDLQLAVYALVAKRMAQAWNTPQDAAVAYIYLRSGESDRSWWGADYAILERATKAWLAAARETLERSAFARTPNPEDCKYCPFKPVCAPEIHRAAKVLDDPRAAKRFKLLKLPEES
jgi:hypothetical protein